MYLKFSIAIWIQWILSCITQVYKIFIIMEFYWFSIPSSLIFPSLKNEDEDSCLPHNIGRDAEINVKFLYILLLLLLPLFWFIFVNENMTHLNELIGNFFHHSSVGKESACNAEDPVWFLGWEDPLEKG